MSPTSYQLLYPAIVSVELITRGTVVKQEEPAGRDAYESRTGGWRVATREAETSVYSRLASPDRRKSSGHKPSRKLAPMAHGDMFVFKMFRPGNFNRLNRQPDHR